MADLSGEQLGPFAIKALLGTGGFATVYRAHDARLNDDVAIKILAENHALNAETRERFIAEAHALRRISSPGVIQIYDIRETPDGRPYLVLEYADRGDLVHRRRDLVANGWSASEPDVRLVIDSVADALEAIHAEDLVHRDITPANVLLRSGKRTVERPGVMLLDQSERLLLSDMGLVKDMSDGSALTVGGGTAGFWAPEQQQQLTNVDHRTDIYAATALIVWMLTGAAVGMTPHWRELVADGGWSMGLQNALGRGLSSRPEARPQSITEWRHEVTSGIDDFSAQPAARLRDASTHLEPGVDRPTSDRVSETPSIAPHHIVSADSTTEGSGSNTGLKLALTALVALLAIGAAAFFALRDTEGTTAVGDQNVEASATPASTNTTTDQTEQQSTATTTAVTPTPSPAPADTGQPTPVAPPTGTTADAFALAMHPNGSQVVVTDVAADPTQTIIAGRVTNGRDFTTSMDFSSNNTFLTDDTGRRYELVQGYDEDLDQGQIANFVIAFEPVAADTVNTLTVHLNDRTDIAQDIDQGFPGFVLSAVDIGQPVALPELPDDLPIVESQSHPSTITVRVQGVSFTDTHIAVGFVATNTGGRQRSISNGNSASHLEDDLGNQYRLKFQGDNRFLRINEGQEMSGVLVFAGRIHPTATQLTLVMNADESTTDDATSSPKFVLGPWSLDGSTTAAILPSTLTINETQQHPNTSAITVRDMEFAATGTLVAVNAANPRSTAIRLNACCSTSYLLDDLGNRYLLAGAQGNDDLEIQNRTEIDAVLSFPGRIQAEATTIELVLGDQDEFNLTDPDTWRPTYRFGPFDLTAAAAPPDQISPPANFGSTTTFASQPVLATTISE